MDIKNYLDLVGLTDFFERLQGLFAKIGHTHSKSEITDLVVDSSLSSTSTNPIENKAVNSALKNIDNKVDDHISDTDSHFSATERTTLSELANETIVNAVSSKGVLTLTKNNDTELVVNTQDNLINITRAEYDALAEAGALDADCYYFVTDDPDVGAELLERIGILETEMDTKVPTTRTVNGKALSSDISLSASDVKADSAGSAQAVRDELTDELSNKVDKVSGKGLSTNDYTTTEKNKLSAIENNAQKNQNAFSNIKVGNITVSADSETDVVELVAGTNLEIVADATNDKITINAKGKEYTTGTSTEEGLTKLYTTTGAATDGTMTQGAITTAIDSAKTEITTAVNPRLDSLDDIVANKVDKISGKGLSSNDYTTSEKNKLAGIASGAEVNQNAFSNIKVGNSTIAADDVTDTLEIASGDNITIGIDTTNDKLTISAIDTTYSAGTGIGITGTTISNAGVRSVSTGDNNGTIKVNTNGTSTNVQVKGLGTAAYTDSSAYDASGSASQALTDAKAYTKQQIDAIVGEGAAETLDTIGEISAAILEHQEVTDALNAAIGQKAPTDHSSAEAIYGVGNNTEYGHLKLSDSTNSASDISGGIAASPKAVKTVKDKVDTVETTLNTLEESFNTHKTNADIHFTTEERTKLSNIENGANNYVHPNSGITLGVYNTVTVDEQGHITKGESIQVDWNQNESNSNDYIKNRPFYGDYTITRTNLVTSNRTFTPASSDECLRHFTDVSIWDYDYLYLIVNGKEYVAPVQENDAESYYEANFEDGFRIVQPYYQNSSKVRVSLDLSIAIMGFKVGITYNTIIVDGGVLNGSITKVPVEFLPNNYAGINHIHNNSITSIEGNNGVLTIAGNFGTYTIDTQENFIRLTKAEYNELVATGSIDEEAFYFITDDITDETYITNITSENGILTYTTDNGEAIEVNTQDNFIKLTKVEYNMLVEAGQIDENAYYFITDDCSAPQLINYVTFPVSGWTANADSTEWTQTVTVSDITAEDEPTICKNLPFSANATYAKAYNKAFGILCSGVAETIDGGVRWKVYKLPATDVSVGLIRIMA